MPGPIKLHGEISPALSSALDEFGLLLRGRLNLEIDVDCSVELRELFRKYLADGIFDISNFVRLDSHQPALGATDVLVSFEPSQLFLELLAALRAGSRDGL